MEKEKKRNNFSRLIQYAGGHRALTILGCVLSAIAAILGLAPYLCIWLVARDTLAVFPDLTADVYKRQGPHHGLDQIPGALMAEGKQMLQLGNHTNASFPTFHWAER